MINPEELLARLDKERQIHNLIDDSRTPHFPRLGHCVPIQYAEQLVAALRSTLAELWAERNRRLLAEKAMSKTAAYKFEQDLNAERKVWEEERRLTERTYELILQRAEAAERKLAEVEKDAERYLKYTEVLFTPSPWPDEFRDAQTKEELDAAIDAALAQKGEKS